VTTFLIHEGRTFEDQTIYITGNAYIGCTFKRCTLVYAGLPYRIVDSQAIACNLQLSWLVHDRKQWLDFLKNIGPIVANMLPRQLESPSGDVSAQ